MKFPCYNFPITIVCREFIDFSVLQTIKEQCAITPNPEIPSWAIIHFTTVYFINKQIFCCRCNSQWIPFPFKTTDDNMHEQCRRRKWRNKQKYMNFDFRDNKSIEMLTYPKKSIKRQTTKLFQLHFFGTHRVCLLLYMTSHLLCIF